jgi:hypothetical protein
MVNAKSIGWAIYAAGLVIWLFGYLSAGHAPVFDWKMGAPWWMSSFVPNFEAELGLALMFASMIPIYGRAVRKRAQVFGYVVSQRFWLSPFTLKSAQFAQYAPIPSPNRNDRRNFERRLSQRQQLQGFHPPSAAVGDCNESCAGG